MCLLPYGAPASAQTVTATSYRRARTVVERGLAALGGSDRARSIERIHCTSHASVAEIGHSANPTWPSDQRPLHTSAYLDITRLRVHQHLLTQFRGSGPRGTRAATMEHSGLAVDMRSNAVYPMDEAGVVNTNAALRRVLPHLLLQSALRRAASLRSLGEAPWHGREGDVADFVDADGTRLPVFCDRRTGLPEKTETQSDAFRDGLGGSERITPDSLSQGVRSGLS